MATAPAQAAEVDLNKVAQAYVNIREKKRELVAAHEKAIADLDGKLEMLEGVMLTHFNKHNVDSVKTEAGTMYRTEQITPSIADDVAFFEWVKKNDAFDALQRRVSVGFVKEFAAAHDGLPPPGINVHREYVARVRKAP